MEKVMLSYGYDIARNVVFFGFDSIHHLIAIMKKNNFLVLSERPMEGINDSAGAEEKQLVLTLVKQR